MAIDPVILIMERIRRAESDLRVESKLNSLNYSRTRADLINATLLRIRVLYDDLTQTVPTSSLGAAELIRITAHRLPFSHARYACHLERGGRTAERGGNASTMTWYGCVPWPMRLRPGNPTTATTAPPRSWRWRSVVRRNRSWCTGR